MGRRAWIAVTIALAGAIVGSLLAWGLFVGLPRWYAARQAPPTAGLSPVAPVEPERKIKARLFYVSEDGRGLTSEERDVPYGTDVVAQARAIIEAQIAPVAEPLVSAIPAGTKLRAVFVTGTAAYVDVTGEIASAHPRGSLDEQLTTYSVVGALTANLPANTAVQILVDGKEVDTLAGHVDLRQPLTAMPEWVR
jgi:spore germination protein GerM